jgi:hypothetical protein
MRHRSAESWRGLLRRYLQDELKGFRQKYLALPRKPTPDPIIQSTVANADVETTSTSALVAPTLHSDEDSDSSWNDDSSDSDWEVDSSPSAPLEERTSPPAWTSTKSNPISYTNDDFQRVAEFLAQDLDDVSYRQKWAAFEVKVCKPIVSCFPFNLIRLTSSIHLTLQGLGPSFIVRGKMLSTPRSKQFDEKELVGIWGLGARSGVWILTMWTRR